MPNYTQIKLLLNQPLPIILRKVKAVLLEKISVKKQSKQYLNFDYRKFKSFDIQFEYGKSIFNQIETSEISIETQEYLTKMYLQHRFDLLGTGWIKNSYHSESPGIEDIKFENTAKNLIIDNSGNWLNEIIHSTHVEYSRFLWKKIIHENNDYQPIDWQKDYKSGFRFCAKTTYNKQFNLVATDGIDLKMPWELGRLQHLPQLAIFYKNNPEQLKIISEFKCQLMDFIMTNPIGMGVNWSCTMDVGIRAANICLAYDWFKQLDHKKILDNEFDELVTNYIFSHGIHIFNNFEYKEGLSSNHYLGNIAGLTFISAYLSSNKETDFWLAYSIQELKKELQKQFFNDGSNFEGSTAYHRLSGEMIVYCFALLHQIPDKRLLLLSKINDISFHNKANYYATSFTKDKIIDKSVVNSIYKMLQFSWAYTKPNGEIVQVGDNDSGRFIRLTPCGEFLKLDEAFLKYKNLIKTGEYIEEKYWDENYINHQSFVAAAKGYFDQISPLQFTIEFQVIQNFIKNKYYPTTISEISISNNTFEPLEYSKTYSIDSTIDTSTLQLNVFNDFGFISVYNNTFYLSISFGANKKSHHSWGHQHNDKLSVELQIDNKNILFDPGTYIYTPLPLQRNIYRSTASHNGITVNKLEQNSFGAEKRALFALNKECTTEILTVSTQKIVVKLTTPHYTHIREIKILTNRLIINDYCNHPFKQNFANNLSFSNGYGKILN